MTCSNFKVNTHQVNEQKKYEIKYVNIPKLAIYHCIKSDAKQMLRYFLASTKFMQESDIYHNTPYQIYPEYYEEHGLTTRSLTKLNKVLEEEQILFEFSRTKNKEVLLKFHQGYPRGVFEWAKGIRGGHLKIDQQELTWLIKTLSDSELNVYILLMLINEANLKRIGGFNTYNKLITPKLNMSEDTYQRALKSLQKKVLIKVTQIKKKEPVLVMGQMRNIFNGINIKICKINTFCGYNPSKNTPKNQEIDHSDYGFEEHIEGVSNTKYIKQRNEVDKKSINKKSLRNTGFNFFGLGEKGSLSRPLTYSGVATLLKTTGLDLDQLQESVRNFSDYYFNDKYFYKEVRNPVGALIGFLKKHKKVYLAPEKFLEKSKKVESFGRDAAEIRETGEFLFKLLADTPETVNLNLPEKEIVEEVPKIPTIEFGDIYKMLDDKYGNGFDIRKSTNKLPAKQRDSMDCGRLEFNIENMFEKIELSAKEKEELEERKRIEREKANRFRSISI